MVSQTPTGAKRAHPAMGVKIVCENWFWSRKLQILLAQVIGCQWGYGIQTPWNTRRPFLIVQMSSTGWFFSWTTEREFVECGLPEWFAKTLFLACPTSLQPSAL